MKIIIENLGPIKSFQFDLSKDLMVIFGKNNIGKSYAITVVYLLIKNLSSEINSIRILDELEYFLFTSPRYLVNEHPEFSQIGDAIKAKELKVAKKIKSKDNDIIEVTADMESIFSDLIRISILPSLERSLANSFASIKKLQSKFSKNKLSIQMRFVSFEFSIGIDQNYKLYVTKLELTKKLYVKKSNANRKPHNFEDGILLYYNLRSNKPQRLLANYLPSIYREFRMEIFGIIKNIYFLPASRSGLYQALSTFSAVIAELSKSRNFLTKKIELPNISEPVSDYFLYLSNISKPQQNNKYQRITKHIEDKILKGEVRFNYDSQKIVFYSPKIRSELDLSVTSSMISEIAPIVAYLKFIISDGFKPRFYFNEYNLKNTPSTSSNIIFIEEPEAHLHPEIQVLLMDIFAQLTSLNVKIVMTTHSNYMFNKLSNLILNNSISYNKVGSYLMEMTEDGSVTDEYIMQADKEGIVDANFVDTSEKLYEERQNIFNKISLDVDK